MKKGRSADNYKGITARVVGDAMAHGGLSILYCANPCEVNVGSSHVTDVCSARVVWAKCAAHRYLMTTWSRFQWILTLDESSPSLKNTVVCTSDCLSPGVEIQYRPPAAQNCYQIRYHRTRPGGRVSSVGPVHSLHCKVNTMACVAQVFETGWSVFQGFFFSR